MSKKDGGHAFPNITPDMIVDGGPGMSLRDWFAGQALASIIEASIGNPKIISSLAKDIGIGITNTVATIAYEYADAMIAQREKETDQ